MENHTKEQIIMVIDEFIEYLKSISLQDLNLFEQTAHQKLNEINEVSLKYPDLRPDLIKYTFTATIPIVEKGFLHTQSRRKTFGYTGDFLNMDYVMTIELAETG